MVAPVIGHSSDVVEHGKPVLSTSLSRVRARESMVRFTNFEGTCYTAIDNLTVINIYEKNIKINIKNKYS